MRHFGHKLLLLSAALLVSLSGCRLFGGTPGNPATPTDSSGGIPTPLTPGASINDPWGEDSPDPSVEPTKIVEEVSEFQMGTKSNPAWRIKVPSYTGGFFLGDKIYSLSTPRDQGAKHQVLSFSGDTYDVKVVTDEEAMQASVSNPLFTFWQKEAYDIVASATEGMIGDTFTWLYRRDLTYCHIAASIVSDNGIIMYRFTAPYARLDLLRQLWELYGLTSYYNTSGHTTGDISMNIAPPAVTDVPDESMAPGETDDPFESGQPRPTWWVRPSWQPQEPEPDETHPGSADIVPTIAPTTPPVAALGRRILASAPVSTSWTQVEYLGGFQLYPNKGSICAVAGNISFSPKNNGSYTCTPSACEYTLTTGGRDIIVRTWIERTMNTAAQLAPEGYEALGSFNDSGLELSVYIKGTAIVVKGYQKQSASATVKMGFYFYTEDYATCAAGIYSTLWMQSHNLGKSASTAFYDIVKDLPL